MTCLITCTVHYGSILAIASLLAWYHFFNSPLMLAAPKYGLTILAFDCTGAYWSKYCKEKYLSQYFLKRSCKYFVNEGLICKLLIHYQKYHRSG